MAEALLWSRLPSSRATVASRSAVPRAAPARRCWNAACGSPGSIRPRWTRPCWSIPDFTHVRARTASLKRREFRGFRWLTVDSNVAPQHTLDTVEDIVTNREVRIRGLLLTLKMPDWELAAAIPEYLQRVRSWGYHYVNARQLAFNRQEICVAALAEPQPAQTAGAAPANAANRHAAAADGSSLGTMSTPSRRMRLICPQCAAGSVCGPQEMLQRLRSLGMLRREKEPDWDLVAELFRSAAGRLPCDECGQVGLRISPAEDDFGRRSLGRRPPLRILRPDDPGGARAVAAPT